MTVHERIAAIVFDDAIEQRKISLRRAGELTRRLELELFELEAQKARFLATPAGRPRSVAA